MSFNFKLNDDDNSDLLEHVKRVMKRNITIFLLFVTLVND